MNPGKLWPKISTACILFLILAVAVLEGSSTHPADRGLADPSFSTRDKDFGLARDEQQGGAGLIAGTVRILNGNVVEPRNDLSFASPHGPGLSFSAFYNSKSNIAGPSGFGWTHTYSVFLDGGLASNGQSYLKIVDDSGCAHYFRKEPSGTYKGILFERSRVEFSGGEYIWHRLDGSRYGFSEAGKLRWMEDPVGNRLAIDYDDQGRLDSVADLSSGRSLIFNYNNDGLMESISGPVTAAVGDGIWVRFGYEAGNLTSVRYADDSGYLYEYDDPEDAHNLTAKRSLANHMLGGWDYDGKDRCKTHFSPQGTGVTLEYVSSTRVDVTDAYGITRSYSIGKIGDRKRVLAMLGKAGPAYTDNNVVRWQYDDKMNLVEVQDAGGSVYRYEDHDSRGNARTVRLAAGSAQERVIAFSYHRRLNLPLTHTEASVLGEVRLGSGLDSRLKL